MTLERTITAINRALQDKGFVSIDKDLMIKFKPEKETYEETFSPPSDITPLSRIKIKPRWKDNNFVSGKEYTLKFRINNKKYKKKNAVLLFKYTGIFQQEKIQNLVLLDNKYSDKRNVFPQMTSWWQLGSHMRSDSSCTLNVKS